MRSCVVLRCNNEITNVYTTEEPILLEYGVCREHYEALQNGEPWIDSGDREIYMGQDIPATVKDFRTTTRGGSSGVELTFEVEDRDGTRNPSFWVPELILKNLFEHMKILLPTDE